MFHYGHYNLLKRAFDLSERGRLIVGVSSDLLSAEKGKATFITQEKRMEIISNLRFVDTVILEETMYQKVEDVKKYRIDALVLGADYEKIFPQMPEYAELVSLGCKIIFLPRTPDISTSEIKEKMRYQAELDLDKSSIHNITK